MAISWMQDDSLHARNEPGEGGSPRFTPRNAVIVSRHPAGVQFIRDAAWLSDDVPVISGNATPDDIRGKDVYGNIPMALAAMAKSVYAIEFSGPPPRGQEYTAADMKASGAELCRYRVMEWNRYVDELEGMVE